jgi:hypothetical protein
MKKQEMRKWLASLGFSEKISILKKLRDRSLAIAASGSRGKPSDPKKTVNLSDLPSQSREPHTKS